MLTKLTLLKAIESMHPEVVRSISNELVPTRRDANSIKAIYSIYLLKTFYPGDPAMTRMLFVALVAKLYCPAALLIKSVDMPEIKREISQCLDQCSIRTVSYYLGQARHYYRHVASFRERVIKLSEEL